jgi:hypothetical protein
VESDAGGKLMTTISNEKLQEIIELEKQARLPIGSERFLDQKDLKTLHFTLFRQNGLDRDVFAVVGKDQIDIVNLITTVCNSSASMAAELIELRKEKEKTCEWTYQPDEGYWKTSCGESFFFEEGTLKENRAFFCHNCGKKIIETAIDPNGDADDE